MTARKLSPEKLAMLRCGGRKCYPGIRCSGMVALEEHIEALEAELGSSTARAATMIAGSVSALNSTVADRDRLRAEVERLKTSLGWTLDVIEREVGLAESLPACLRREAHAALEGKP